MSRTAPEERVNESLEAKVGQLFFVGFDGARDAPALRLYLERLRPGGVIHFGRNVIDPAQVGALNEAILGSIEPAPFIAVDQEGGRVSRLRALLPPLPSMAQLADLGEGPIRDYAESLGRALAALGFNTDFAPVVDLSTPGAANLIGDRSFGEDEALVVVCARAFIEGLRRAGVASFVKHFPGLGATEVDSHVTLPLCSRGESDLWRRDLLPFRECASSSAGVMVAHVHCPAFDPGAAVAASLSSAVIEGLLRGRMGYDGISLTDDLEMGAVVGPPPGDLALAALRAGNDMVMFCNSPESALAAHRAVLDEVRAGGIEESRINRSVARILAAKRRIGILGGDRSGGSSTFDWPSALAALRRYAVA